MDQFGVKQFVELILGANAAMLWCATCLLENTNGSIGCNSCGIVINKQIGPPTRTMAYPARATTPLGHKVHLGKLSECGVAIYVGEAQEPLIAEVNDRMLIGRSPDAIHPGLIDLTKFEAYRFGVSRNHVALVRRNNELYLHDIGSINGSWLNGQRLKPYELYSFPSGAAVVLGQMTLYIYY
jgi:hypothetical protein